MRVIAGAMEKEKRSQSEAWDKCAVFASWRVNEMTS